MGGTTLGGAPDNAEEVAVNQPSLGDGKLISNQGRPSSSDVSVSPREGNSDLKFGGYGS